MGAPVSSGGSGQSVVTYQIVVSLDNVPAGILTGMTAQVSIRISAANNVVAIPATALNGTKDSYTVKVMDATAIAFCRDNKIPIVVFDMSSPGALQGILRGDAVGTIVRDR